MAEVQSSTSQAIDPGDPTSLQPSALEDTVSRSVSAPVSFDSGGFLDGLIEGSKKQKKEKKEKKEKKGKKDKKEKKEKKAKKEDLRFDFEKPAAPVNVISSQMDPVLAARFSAQRAKEASPYGDNVGQGLAKLLEKDAMQSKGQCRSRESSVESVTSVKSEASEELSKRLSAQRDKLQMAVSNAQRSSSHYDLYLAKKLAQQSQASSQVSAIPQPCPEKSANVESELSKRLLAQRQRQENVENSSPELAVQAGGSPSASSCSPSEMSPKVETELERRLAAQREKQQRDAGAVQNSGPVEGQTSAESNLAAGVYAKPLKTVSRSSSASGRGSVPVESEPVESELSKRLAAMRDRIQRDIGEVEPSSPVEIKTKAESNRASSIYAKPLKQVSRSNTPTARSVPVESKAEVESELSKRLSAQREKQQRGGGENATSVPNSRSASVEKKTNAESELTKRLAAQREKQQRGFQRSISAPHSARSVSSTDSNLKAESELEKRLAALRAKQQRESNAGVENEQAKQVASASGPSATSEAETGWVKVPVIQAGEEKATTAADMQAEVLTQPEVEPPCDASSASARSLLSDSLPCVKRCYSAQKDASVESELSKRLAAQRAKKILEDGIAPKVVQPSKSEETGSKKIAEQLGKLRPASLSMGASRPSAESAQSELSKGWVAQRTSRSISVPKTKSAPEVIESELSKRLSAQRQKQQRGLIPVGDQGDQESPQSQQRDSESTSTAPSESAGKADSELSKRLAEQREKQQRAAAAAAAGSELEGPLAAEREMQQRRDGSEAAKSIEDLDSVAAKATKFDAYLGARRQEVSATNTQTSRVTKVTDDHGKIVPTEHTSVVLPAYAMPSRQAQVPCCASCEIQ